MTGRERVASLAVRAGLRPTTRTVPERGARRMILNGEGRYTPFGSVTIGAQTGRVLRAQITLGTGRTVNADSLAAVTALLRSLPVA